MAFAQVNPTRMELTRLKRRLSMARRGYKLLKDKRDEMIRRFVSLIRENQSLRSAVEIELGRAMGEFAMARAVMEPEALEEAVMYPARSLELALGSRNILSVNVPVLTVIDDTASGSALSYGLAATSAQLDGAISSLAELMPRLVRLAEIEKKSALLADEIEKTRRRVNALEYTMIPEMERSIRRVTMKLEENERGALSRLMKFKDMIAERTE
jgi:V/A-type H+-transporting ATPase subunit D